jgi:hypothetical protein
MAASVLQNIRWTENIQIKSSIIDLMWCKINAMTTARYIVELIFTKTRIKEPTMAIARYAGLQSNCITHLSVHNTSLQLEAGIGHGDLGSNARYRKIPLISYAIIKLRKIVT